MICCLVLLSLNKQPKTLKPSVPRVGESFFLTDGIDWFFTILNGVLIMIEMTVKKKNFSFPVKTDLLFAPNSKQSGCAE